MNPLTLSAKTKLTRDAKMVTLTTLSSCKTSCIEGYVQGKDNHGAKHLEMMVFKLLELAYPCKQEYVAKFTNSRP